MLGLLGELQATRAQYEEAEASYGQAVAAYDAALARVPDDVAAHNNKGIALQSLGNLQATRARYPEAEESYRRAIASYDAALDRAPHVAAHNNKGNVLGSLGELQVQLGDVEQAMHSLRVAVAEWSRSLEIAPGDQRVRKRRDRAQTFVYFYYRNSSDMVTVPADFEPLLQSIAAVAAGDTAQQGEIELMLTDLETKGWHLSEAVRRIWAGERDETALTAGLDAQDTALVKRLLQIIGEGKS